ncbi:MAG: hypothetical protein KF900_05825 [Bacteroidetes bacterium]|nr:hypothetical protein [Bacteroidota bacterium]
MENYEQQQKKYKEGLKAFKEQLLKKNKQEMKEAEKMSQRQYSWEQKRKQIDESFQTHGQANPNKRRL